MVPSYSPIYISDLVTSCQEQVRFLVQGSAGRGRGLGFQGFKVGFGDLEVSGVEGLACGAKGLGFR